MNTDSRLHQILTGEWQGRNAFAEKGSYGRQCLTLVIALLVGIVLLMLIAQRAVEGRTGLRGREIEPIERFPRVRFCFPDTFGRP
jgi:hypothetical protein